MTASIIPQVNYVTDHNGKPVFVRLSVQDWTSFIEEYQRLTTLLQFKARLKNAFREIRQIQKGEKQATTFGEFLKEL